MIDGELCIGGTLFYHLPRFSPTRVTYEINPASGMKNVVAPSRYDGSVGLLGGDGRKSILADGAYIDAVFATGDPF